MSGVAAPAPAPTRRRWRWPAAVALAVIAVSVLAALGTTGPDADLDPESAAPGGARAVTRILADHGVPVRIVRSRAELRPDEPGTILVAQPSLAPFDTMEQLATAASDVVLVRPDAVALSAFGLPVFPDGVVPARTAQPECADQDAVAAGAGRAGGHLYRVTGPADGTATVCYPERSGAGNGSVVVIERDGRRITVLGQADVLRNDHLAEEGNAALALRLLGHREALQWYVPDPTELPTGQAPTLSELLPEWTRWVPLQLGVVVLVVALWRGRRLGSLVTEPLPVVVRAAETPEGRARLYRQARARALAAATLRTATLRRLARRFEATSADELADRAAHAAGRDQATVRSVLLGAAPADDARLVRLARDLARIEQDVTAPRADPEHAIGPATPPDTQPATTTRDGR